MTRPPVTSLVTPFAVQRLILLHFARGIHDRLPAYGLSPQSERSKGQ